MFRILVHASQSLTTSNKDMTRLHGTRSYRDSACGRGLLKFKVQLHARPGFAACSTCSGQERHKSQPDVCSHHLFSAAHVGSVPRCNVQFGGVVWFPDHANPPNLYICALFSLCYCRWHILLLQRGCNGELKVLELICSMFVTKQGTVRYESKVVHW